MLNKILCCVSLVASFLASHLSYGLSITKSDRQYLAHHIQVARWDTLFDAERWVENLPKMTKRAHDKFANSVHISKVAQKKIQNDMQSIVVDAFVRLYNTLPNTLETRVTILEFMIRVCKDVKCIYDVSKILKADIIKANIADSENENEFVCKSIFDFQKDVDRYNSPYLLQVCMYLCKADEDLWGAHFWLTKIKPFVDKYCPHAGYCAMWEKDIKWWKKII